MHLLNHPLSQPEGIVHSSCVLLGKHLGRGCVVGCVAGCWPNSGSTVQRVLDTGALTLCYFGKNNCREDSWGVSRQSYIRVLSYSFLAAFFSLNLSKKGSRSYFVIMPSGIPACLNVSVLLIFYF